MGMTVGLVGYSYIQATNFANLITPNVDDLDKALFLSANHVNFILRKNEKVSSGVDYELTYNFEAAENEEYVMQDVHFYMQDLLGEIDTDTMSAKEIIVAISTSLSSILADKRRVERNTTNPYMRFVVSSIKLGGLSAITDLISRCDSDADQVELRKLYFSQKNSKSKMVSLYNALFAAIKFELINYLEYNLDLPGVNRYDCGNNCLSFFGHLEEEDFMQFLYRVHVCCRAEESPLSKCINNITFDKGMEEDVTYIYSTFPLDHPIYFKLLEEADYLHFALTKDFTKSSGLVGEQIKYLLKILPTGKTKFYLYKDINLPVSVDEINEIAYQGDYSLTKCFVGDADFTWTPNSEDTPKETSYFKQSPTEDIPSEEEDEEISAASYPTSEDRVGESLSNISPQEASMYFDNILYQTKLVGMRGLRKVEDVKGFDSVEDEDDTFVDAAMTSSNGYENVQWFGNTYCAEVADDTSIQGELANIQYSVKAVAQTASDIAKISFDQSMLTSNAIDELTEMMGEVKKEIIDNVQRGEAQVLKSEQELGKDSDKARTDRADFERLVALDCENLLLAGTCNEFLHKFVKKVSELKNLQCIEGYTSEYLADNLKVSLVNALYTKYTMDAYSLWTDQLAADLDDPEVPNSEVYINILNKLF